MKRWLKTLWICIAIGFAAGLALCLIAFAAGARGTLYLDQSGFHYADSQSASTLVTKTDAEAFSDIDISLVGGSIDFVQADSYGYQIVSNGDDNIGVSLENGRLKITEDPKWRFQLFNFDFLRGALQQQYRVTVYLPKDCQLTNLSLQTVSSDTEFAVDGLEIANFGYDSISGSLVVYDDSGIVTKELSLKSISGNIDFVGAASSYISIDTISGSAVLSLSGRAEDYYFSIDRISGRVRVDGESLTGKQDMPVGSLNFGSPSAPSRADIHLISGDVEFKFTK